VLLVDKVGDQGNFIETHAPQIQLNSY